MPSPLIHAQVAYEFKNKCLDDLTPSFLLGMMAPDAIHMRALNTWSDKAITHFYELADLSFERALLQAMKELNQIDHDFVTGYVIHLYTDYLWREQMYTPFFLERKDKMARCDLHACYYRDMARLDQRILHQATWLDEVRIRLQVATPQNAMPLLSEAEVMAWRDKIVTQDFNLENKSLVVGELEAFSIDQVHQFIKTCTDKIKHVLSNI